ncbi:MAG: hypothetical protein JST04_04110 [Bdellovibrionales bacterium]|nr:hypothetical protein [Bdellovibrionales bacterium]
MRFSKQTAADHDLVLQRLERSLRIRDAHVRRREGILHGEFFRWSELMSAKDADAFGWRRVRAESRGSGVQLRFEFNWPLQLATQTALSGFVAAFVGRFGEPAMIAPMLVTANGLFFAASAILARRFAVRFAREVFGETRN